MGDKTNAILVLEQFSPISVHNEKSSVFMPSKTMGNIATCWPKSAIAVFLESRAEVLAVTVQKWCGGLGGGCLGDEETCYTYGIFITKAIFGNIAYKYV